MSTELDRWLKEQKYLPSDFRDFHDQKDLFKAIDQIVETPDRDDHVKRPSWIEAHCYVIDVFLWFMARRGYTLQKSRAKLPFRNLSDDITSQTKARSSGFASILSSKN